MFLNKINGYPNEECVVKVFDYWLNIHPDQPTWKEMADALDDIQEYDLANTINGIYKTTCKILFHCYNNIIILLSSNFN